MCQKNNSLSIYGSSCLCQIVNKCLRNKDDIQPFLLLLVSARFLSSVKWKEELDEYKGTEIFKIHLVILKTTGLMISFTLKNVCQKVLNMVSVNYDDKTGDTAMFSCQEAHSITLPSYAYLKK